MARGPDPRLQGDGEAIVAPVTATPCDVDSAILAGHATWRRVPLERPLCVRARVTGAAGRKVSVTGSITTEADPDARLVVADAVFIAPDPQRDRALFPGMRAQP
ncbi:hypothetical protein BIV25_10265 [Streptomyces sp. MUSC 14]|nr:hypothetical protein BIV25_10265 [Streptomyces sp. MUSC 14]